MISFIVSVFDRPHVLNACLASLSVQQDYHEILICGNHTDDSMLVACGLIADRYGLKVEKTGLAGCKTCYESANMVAPHARGDWLCFPSDDSLYVQGFSRIMLDTAEREKADLVYCDCVYRSGPTANQAWPSYSVLNVQPRMGKIDKTCFILRASLFDGFPPHPRDWRDGALIEQLVRDGVRHAKAPGILVVHQ